LPNGSKTSADCLFEGVVFSVWRNDQFAGPLNGWRGDRVLPPTFPKVDKIDDPCHRVETENRERDPSPVVVVLPIFGAIRCCVIDDMVCVD
jgi:hypothetical protein